MTHFKITIFWRVSIPEPRGGVAHCQSEYLLQATNSVFALMQTLDRFYREVDLVKGGMVERINVEELTQPQAEVPK